MELVERTDVAPLTSDEAADLTDAMRESVADLEQMVVRAYFGRAWDALGYESWDDYVHGEFKRAPLALPREDRRVQVASLRSQGMSLRAIGSVAGVDPMTVKNDVEGVENSTPASVTGIDGKEYAVTRPEREQSAPTQKVEDTTPLQDEPCPYCGQTLPADFQHKG